MSKDERDAFGVYVTDAAAYPIARLCGREGTGRSPTNTGNGYP
jgi:hypothetical protein